MTNNNVNAKLYNNFDTIKHQPQKNSDNLTIECKANA